MKSTSKKILTRAGLGLGILLLAGGGYYLLRYPVWGAYREWSIARMNGMAREFLAADDPRNAMLIVRKVLRKRPNDAEAWRLGVAAARQSESKEVVAFQRNLCRVEPSAENQVELIRLALDHQLHQVALEAVAAVPEKAGALPEFHELAAQVYRLAGREVVARYHLVSLLALRPDDQAAQFALAETEFEIEGQAVAPDWIARVKKLARAPGLEGPAVLLQLRLAVARQDVAAATPLVERLRSRIDLSVSQRLQVLEALELCQPAEARRYQAELLRQAMLKPEETALVMAWLARKTRWPELTTWYARLPEEAQQDEKVRLAAARGFEAQRDWTALVQVVRGSRWTHDETQRLALLARAYRMTGRTADFAETWKLAVIAIGPDLRAGVRLLQTVAAWDWTTERRDVLWKIFGLVPTNRPVREELITYEFGQGNTVNLNKIFARIVEAEPANDEARNNFSYTSLLLDTNPTRAQAIARDLHREHPGNVSYLTTYTLALHKQGDSVAALRLLEGLAPGLKTTPAVMLHEAVYAAETGRNRRANELLPQVARMRMLPEEGALVAASRMALARDSVRDGRQQLLAATTGGATGGWLDWLPDTARKASVDIRLANQFYRDQDFPALAKLVEETTWPEEEHLRHALAAYSRRQMGAEAGGRDAWRQAMGAGGRDSRRLRELEILTTHWNWQPERMEVAARRFEREATNPVLLAELLEFYRQQARTPDLARTLWLYVNETNSTGAEAAWCVYYSLLCGVNVNSAQTLAHRVYSAAPQAAQGRIAYAFALWRQQRFGEAWKLLQNLDPEEAAGMQVGLVQAAILLELDRKGEAQDLLSRFVAADAMPEEKILAETLSRKIGPEVASMTLSTHFPSAR